MHPLHTDAMYFVITQSNEKKPLQHDSYPDANQHSKHLIMNQTKNKFGCTPTSSLDKRGSACDRGVLPYQVSKQEAPKQNEARSSRKDIREMVLVLDMCACKRNDMGAWTSRLHGEPSGVANIFITKQLEGFRSEGCNIVDYNGQSKQSVFQ